MLSPIERRQAHLEMVAKLRNFVQYLVDFEAYFRKSVAKGVIKNPESDRGGPLEY